ncbi:MAG TPA: hypothetical protein VHT52_21305 [Stellaceae bacterium]|nr:hypothetical protein [Stellaceae bacterium]
MPPHTRRSWNGVAAHSWATVVLLGLQLQDIYGIGPRIEQRLRQAGCHG